MKQKEIDILNLFDEPDKVVSSSEIKNTLHVKDPSGTLRDLEYFDYLIKTDGGFVRTRKPYNEQTRLNEKREQNYEIVLNKIFSGGFVTSNLGHELINFLKDDNNQRYVYLNPWGERGEGAAEETQYAYHIIESSISDENGVYELVAISEINQDGTACYSQDRNIEKASSPVFHNHSFVDIFYCGDDTDKAHVYTYKASRLFKPVDGLRILIKIKRDCASIVRDNNLVTVTLMCNPQHQICYADGTGKKTYGSLPNQTTDVDVLHELLDLSRGYIEENNDNVDIDNLDDELCLAVICDRTNLEDSMSNQIEYFFNRDSGLLHTFLQNFLNINVDPNEKFEIVREKEKSIDLLFKSQNHVIVIENKIDSDVNGVAAVPNPNGKYNSQLSKYYDYVQSEYHIIPNKHFFVLAPEYNSISRHDLDNKYEKGDQYVLKTYNQLFNSLRHVVYSPLGNPASPLGEFLYSQFIKGIEYISWSKAKQHERTAYIRLNQRIKELDHR